MLRKALRSSAAGVEEDVALENRVVVRDERGRTGLARIEIGARQHGQDALVEAAARIARAAADGGRLGTSAHGCDRTAQPVAGRRAIGVEKHDEFSRGRTHALVLQLVRAGRGTSHNLQGRQDRRQVSGNSIRVRPRFDE